MGFKSSVFRHVTHVPCVQGSIRYRFRYQQLTGRLRERLKRLDWKSMRGDEPHTGSNPVPSATMISGVWLKASGIHLLMYIWLIASEHHFSFYYGGE